MKKLFLFIIVFFACLFVPCVGQTDTVTYKSYYPIPYATFNKIRLYPQDIATHLTACSVPGQVYFDESDNVFRMCNKKSTTYIRWNYMPGVWNQIADVVSLSDTLNPSLKKVGIGTYNPIAKLTIDIDAGILAQGTQGSGTALGSAGFSAGSTQFIWYPRKAAIIAGSMGDQASLNNRIKRNDDQVGNYSAAFGIATFAAADYSFILAGAYAGVDSNSSHTTIITHELPPGLPSSESPHPNSFFTKSTYSVFSGVRNEIYGMDQTVVFSDYSFVGLGGSALQKADYAVSLGYRTSIASFADGGADFVVYANKPDLDYNSINLLGSTSTAGNISYSAVLSAVADIQKSPYAFIGNGSGLRITDGGIYNTILSGVGCIIGGSSATATAPTASTIMSGSTQKTGISSYAFIGGGLSNQTLGDFGVVLGGSSNIAGTRDTSGSQYMYASVGGGQYNKAYATGSFIGGGLGNIVGTPLASGCGDGDLDTGEECDGSDFGSATCATKGFLLGGTLSCSPTCTIETDGCIPCAIGDGRCDPVICGENCSIEPACGACCGNGICEAVYSEDCSTCPADCGICACGASNCMTLTDKTTCEADSDCDWLDMPYREGDCGGSPTMDCSRWTTEADCNNVLGCSWLTSTCSGTYDCNSFTTEADCQENCASGFCSVTGCLWQDELKDVCFENITSFLSPTWFDYYPPDFIPRTVVTYNNPHSGLRETLYDGPRLLDSVVFFEFTTGECYLIYRDSYTTNGYDPDFLECGEDPGLSCYGTGSHEVN